MEKSESNFQISPETKIGSLLDRFPDLEKTLLEMAPEFKKLRNPILRKTIARVTSLRQESRENSRLMKRWDLFQEKLHPGFRYPGSTKALMHGSCWKKENSR